MAAYIEGILPKGPYLAWRVGPFWQDTIKIWVHIGAGSSLLPNGTKSWSEQIIYNLSFTELMLLPGVYEFALHR